MKKIYLFCLFTCLIFTPLSEVFCQGGTWTWISGDSALSSTGVFGTQGVPSVNNHPPAMYEPAEWKDKQGNFWIYGGTYPGYADLWKFNPATKEWTWVHGNGMAVQAPVYGTQGVPSASNNPGTKILCAASWVDTSGAFWLLGGSASKYNDCYNALWRYDIGSNEWTWVKGDSAIGAKAVHGVRGVASPLNTPGARNETCSAWTDSLNNLWLFGGRGYADDSTFGPLNDVMRYNISSNEWTWMKGSPFTYAAVNYGTKGVTTPGNDPGARFTYNKWKDLQGNLWLLGGTITNLYIYNDVWKYDASVNNWTWMSGPNGADTGKYGATCVFDAISHPCQRMEQRSSVTDNCGRFWFFGGIGSNGYLNDLWVFDPQQLKWNWLSGSNAGYQLGNYGSLGVSSPGNMPPSRCGAAAWWGNDNKFYLFGGLPSNQNTNCLADVWVYSPDTNCVPVCNGVAVSPPVADFQSSKTTICANDCINYTDLSTNADSWQWRFAGATDSTSNSKNPQNICYQESGIYNVTLFVSNSGGSDSITFSNYITVNPSPPTPTVTQLYDTLFCSTDPTYTSYQWYDSSAIITGATDSIYITNHSGNYNVKVTNANGCSAATGINIILGLEHSASVYSITLSPNPVEKEFTVYGLPLTVSRVEILNVLGQVCGQSKIVNRRSEIEVDISLLASGIYFVRIENENGAWVNKIVKQ